jgi:hypothetical protein
MRGGQWQALSLMRGLAARGHKVRLLAPKKSPLLSAAAEAGLDARPLWMVKIPAAAAGADLVHAHDARGHTLAVFSGRPVVVARRVAFPIGRSPASFWKYMRATRLIAVSEFVKGILTEAGVDRRKIGVVYDGVPIPPSTRPVPGAGAPVVALDSKDPGKCSGLVAQAAALANLPLVFTRDLPRDLNGAAAFLYLTTQEGLGSAALLAMAYGVPVIASAVGGLPEVVEDGATGLLVRNDPLQAADALRRLHDNPALGSHLAAQGRKRVEQEFSVDHMVAGTIAEYERALG